MGPVDNSTGPASVFPSVVGMSEYDKISISGEGIAALGTRLADIADYLEARAAPGAGWAIETYGFATHTGTGALNEVLRDAELERKAVTTELRRLRDLASDAGGVFVRTEHLIDVRNRGAL